ncbi:XRE family transcriptional regulator [Vibrio sp.]|nr:XRE family transcriptional regulator [Vibrio sp.]
MDITLSNNQDDTASEANPLLLGNKIKKIRSELGLTLEEASARTGLARSTLSKIENDNISPTFQAMQKLANGLNIDMPQLFEPTANAIASGRRDVCLKGQGKQHPTPTYQHELLAHQLSNKKMFPFKCKVRARSFDEFKEWIKHDGEEFLLVLSGTLCFYSEFYEPVELSEGDSVYYDASMGHALISVSENDAEALWVTAK